MNPLKHPSVLSLRPRALVRRLWVAAIMLPPMALCLLCASAQAAGTVTNLLDSGSGSLRNAVLGGGNVTFLSGLSGTIKINSTIQITSNTTITGPGASLITVDGHNNDGPSPPAGLTVFWVLANQASISGLTIANGQGWGYDTTSQHPAYNNGGGIDYESAGTLTVTKCLLVKNHSFVGGGILNNGGGTIVVTGCSIIGDAGQPSKASVGNYHGSGFANRLGTMIMTNCTVTGNNGAWGTAFENGGVVRATGCIFTGNTAGAAGSGLLNTGTATLTSCLVVGNGITNTGNGSLTLTGCTLANDSTNGSMAAGTYALNSTTTATGSVTLVDDILWGDASSEISAPSVSASYCDIQEVAYGGGYPGSGPAAPYPGMSNINVNPLFVRSPNLSVMPFDFGDEHLVSGPPCRGAGIPATGNTTDLDGRPRSAPPSMGAYE